VPQGQRTDLSQMTPAMYDHVCRVYAEMLRHAAPDLEGEGRMMYEGHLTRLFRELRLSVPYYTQIKNLLTTMGCIEQVKRGGGNATSRWLLWREPSLEAFQEALGKKTFVNKGSKVSALEQQLRDLSKRVTVLELAVTNVQEVEVS
jgi:hypothetical protein